MAHLTEDQSHWKRNTALLSGAAFLSAGLLFLAWRSHPDVAYWLGLADDARVFLEAHPWALVLLLATLPGLGFPSSPIIILFGVVLVPRFGLPATLALGIAAQALCTTWTYALAAGPLRLWLLRLFYKNRPLPDMSSGNALRLGLILRLTPGIPYALQNIVLGLVGMRLRPYLLVSIPATSLWTLGFITTGGALFEGETGMAISGLAIIIVLVVATRMISRKYKIHAG
ncbi:MAG: hypothetical protein GVY36_00940 [Verrucomicrobia bacterium]|jgi:uncharacterized membrane protein YdjX (TVP38/TMEM64 family)|nr:hypothetical protein [Verrucomicrobiota bacterium]